MSGMKTVHLVGRIESLLKRYKSPSYIIIHCGGNDLGQNPVNSTQLMAMDAVRQIQSLTHAKIIWSQILPRLVYRNEINHVKLNKARRRFNTELSRFCMNEGGAYIRHPQIVEKSYLFRDHVHLSDIGNDMFLCNIKHGLNAIIYLNQCCFPDNRF